MPVHAEIRLTDVPPLPCRSSASCSSSGSLVQSFPSAAASASALSTRTRNRPDAARSASSGSTFSRLATLTAAKSTSPSSANTCAVGLDLGRRLATRRRERVVQLPHLVLEVRHRAREIRVLEPDHARPPLQLARVQQRRERLRHLVEDTLAALLRGLDPLPILAHTTGGLRLDLAEDVRVPPDELLVHRPRHLRQIALAALLEQQREKVDLEEQVAELVEQLRVVSRERRVRDLVGLLDGMRHDRQRRLLTVPGAVSPQALGQPLQIEQRVRERHLDAHAWTGAQPVVVALVVVDAVTQGSGLGMNPTA